MSQKTGIEWTEATWNPIRGCSRVSDGCRNCYAETVAKRFSGPGQPYEGLIAKGGQWSGKVSVIDHKMDEPLRWAKPRMIFVNSMSDLFHESVDFETIYRIMLVMQKAQHHTFQVLTKRPKRMLQFFDWWGGECKRSMAEVMPNLWLGVSVEDQKTADERIPLLLETPATIRWVSAEPLLGPVVLQGLAAGESMEYDECRQYLCEEGPKENPYRDNAGRLNWIVVGGESGSGARPMHPDWARSLRDQCVKAGVPYLFKQWGEWLPDNQNSEMSGPFDPNGAIRVGKKSAGRNLDGRKWDQFPEAGQ
ncbi:DUF5131 family protein [Marinobacter salarius]|uniref:DUF5131 family protein n=1 Tax=Marinobacter salarius TaxID=1420917 RepID=UPI003D0C2153